MTSNAAALYPPLNERPIKDTVVLFDVDGTLTPARRVCYLSHRPAIMFNLTVRRM